MCKTLCDIVDKISERIQTDQSRTPYFNNYVTNFYKLSCFKSVTNRFFVLTSKVDGLNYSDLARELPDALQHRHPPEPGVRHAINVQEGTILCGIFGEGEIVVNSEHRAGIQRLAMGFRVSGTALDGVIEAIEFATDAWFALGVQWQPAAGSASGLDIQVFRAVIDAAKRKSFPALVTTKTPVPVAA